ncbi:DUF551 domain-containing protein [Variovorax atrisoli]|uniref:DUF551 domain-containing protein n=1 Tax=Variovorax atrisoli TaxID=3394203 RepID=UPI0012FDD86F|nr:DUF551 domain-containing protein [Variovorax paradoxus]
MPDLRDEFEALMPEPAAHRYMSHGHSSRWQLAGRAVPPDAEPLYTADQMRTAMQAVWDAATERAAKEAWLPIETAPRDGRLFIAFRPLAERTHDPVISLVSGQEFNRGCWESTVPKGMDGSNYTSGYCKATHWMPLPEAPAAAIRSSGRGEQDNDESKEVS